MNKFFLFKKQLKWLILAWSVICFLLMLQYLITEIFRPKTYSPFQIINSLSVRLLVGFFLILLIIPSYNYFKNKISLTKILGLLIICLFYSISQTFLNGLFADILKGGLDFEKLYDNTVSTIILSLYHDVTYYVMFIGILVSIDYLEAKIIAIKNREKIIEELAQAKISILTSQLQPHFLFNSLNSISAIIDYRKDAAQDMLADLSSLLRISLQTDYNKSITLEEEINILNKYINIEKRRFEHQLKIEKNIQDQALHVKVPPFLLQPLVENSIKHGFSEGINELEIRIKVLIEDNHLIILVSNNGAELSYYSSGIGIGNLKNRLKTFYDDHYNYVLRQEEKLVVNQIKIQL